MSGRASKTGEKGPPAQKLLCLGVISGAHGIKGEVVIRSFTAAPLDIGAYGPLSDRQGGREFVITPLRLAKKGVIARIEGVNDRNMAESLRGTELFIERRCLPEPEDEDEFYYADLIGLEARSPDGKRLGEVVAMHDFGAGDLIEIHFDESGKSEIFPFERKTVPLIEIKKGFVVFSPPHVIEKKSG